MGVQCQQGYTYYYACELNIVNKLHCVFNYVALGEIYHEGDIRLMGGFFSWHGRVEIYLYGEWGTISHDKADNQDAHVVCQQLGYDTRCKFISVKFEINVKFKV